MERRRISLGSVAMVLPLTWQITNMAGWVARSVTSIFENIGTVQDGMRSIAVERQMPDPPDARELVVTRGEISFEKLHFDYGRVRRLGDRGGCCAASICTSHPASASVWSARRAPASPPW